MQLQLPTVITYSSSSFFSTCGTIPNGVHLFLFCRSCGGILCCWWHFGFDKPQSDKMFYLMAHLTLSCRTTSIMTKVVHFIICLCFSSFELVSTFPVFNSTVFACWFSMPVILPPVWGFWKGAFCWAPFNWCSSEHQVFARLFYIH